jgi:ornithine cyclodeaminase/alanine dehydrogenase-like protein (mu-crystallin family)
MTLICLDADDVRSAISMPAAIEAVRLALLELAAGNFEQPVRTAMRDGQFLIMSIHHRPSASAMVKTLGLNFDRVPAISGTVAWVEVASAIELVADAAAVTSLRTGAICGLATDLLASPSSSRLAMVGAGGQAFDQVRAVHAVRPLEQIWVTDLSQGRATALVERLTEELPTVSVEVAYSVADAVRSADIVTCATPATEPVLLTSMLPSRVHVNAIGAFRPSMRELPDDLLAEATVVIDDRKAILKESGEILHALASGAIGEHDLTVLGDALSHPLLTRERTVFKTVGIAAQDWAIARALTAKFA